MNQIIIKILIKVINWLNTRGRTVAKPVDTERYNPNPVTSLCMQFFNKKDNIVALWEGISRSGADEIVILEDGSSDGSLSEWASLATGKNHFIIRSNDIFEVRTYDRAINFTRGEIIGLLQDDDLPPRDPSWLQNALALFDKFPKLAVLGGRNAIALLPVPKVKSETSVTYRRYDTKAGVPDVFEYEIIEAPRGKTAGLSFEFAQVINRAPMFIRRSVIRDLGGIDQRFAPYQCDDVDICLRAWKAGFQVGLYRSGFARDIGVGGMRLYNTEINSHVLTNWKLIYQLHGEEICNGTFADMVRRMNTTLIKCK